MTLSKELLETLEAGCSDLKSRYIDARLDLETANARLSLLDAKKIKLARAALVSTKSSAWKTGRVQIHFIIYGYEYITDDSVARRLISYAENGVEFGWNNGLFYGRPEAGWHKGGAVLYRYNNAGEMKCLMPRQNSCGGNQTARFDAF